eukprot:TRINITY_DN12072_c0_g1_i1.p1 TRINITY_DN12072_c0_g1~~TRINITY_DN12072_c0_g1_i1.p1  ORF type:complete len:214 (+),score=78.93 TRINITY_DN12072_c0_g1_i1:137-778(+)
MQGRKSGRVVPTKLKLKGKPVDIHKIVRNAKRLHPETQPVDEPEPELESLPPQREEKVEVQPVKEGTGRIMTSLTTVHGKDTDFLKELEPGDKLIVYNDQIKEDEERLITMVLGNKSLGIKEAFTRDSAKFVEFKYQKKPVVSVEKDVEELVEEKMRKIATQPDGKQKTVVEYRKNAGPWTYKKVSEEVEGSLTREQQLDMRVKQTRDKFCWC